MAKKDNLTDIVEQLPKVDTSEIPKVSESDPKPKKDEQQVVNSEGEIITLSKKEDKE